MRVVASVLLWFTLSLRADTAEHDAFLAKSYCQSCHLFPEPSLLDKQTWASGALRRMAPFLGAARINLDQRPDGKILQEAGIFPTTPLVSESDWQAIHRYYLREAPEKLQPQAPRPAIARTLPGFELNEVPYPGAVPMVTMVKVHAGLLFIGNARLNTLDSITPAGKLVSRVRVPSPPVDATFRPEGIYLTLIGNVFPSDERNGKIVLVQDGKIRTIVEDLPRPTSAVFADLNGDARDDILVSAFGNYVGKLSLFEALAGGGYREQVLLAQPGALRVLVHNTQTFVLMAQARESILLFDRDGEVFRHQVLAEFHPAFGATHLEMADFNSDRSPDLLVTNGDNGDYPSPFKPYHGIRIFLNDENNNFAERWFFPLNGAFKAVSHDFDNDGDLDLAAISFFPNYEKTPEESFVYFENRGGLDFAPASFAGATMGRWITMDAGDCDNDGKPDIVLGSFPQGPASIPIPQSLQQKWTNRGPGVIWLRNVR